MLKPLRVTIRDNPEGFFILINGLLEDPQQGLCIDRRGDDSGVERCRCALCVELAEVEQEFEGVVADLKIIGVSAMRLTSILQVISFPTHHNFGRQSCSPSVFKGPKFIKRITNSNISKLGAKLSL